MKLLCKKIMALETKNALYSFDRRITYALSFVFPFLLMLIIYALFGVHPVGENTVITFDLNTQFSLFLDYFRRVLLGEESLFYSFSKGMGGNMYGLFTYYLSSPFSLLMIFFPKSVMPEGIALIIALKIACCGLTSAIFLTHVFKKSDLSVVLFSCCYALCGYMMYYSMCIMWIDGLIWLPIILLGVERILSNKSGLLFVFSYVISMCSNYYTGYMTTIFVAIYFFSRYFALTDKTDKKDLLKKTLVMLAWGAVGLLMCTVILLPTFLDILNGKMSLDKTALETSSSFITQNIENTPRHLFIGQFDDIVIGGNPPIFCGMLSGLMLSVYIFNPKIKLRAKISTLAVFVIFFISFFIAPIDKIWHIFQKPHGAFPFRYSYALCFFTVITAFEGYKELDNTPRKSLYAAIFIYAAILIDRFIFKNSSLTSKTMALISILCVAVYVFGILYPIYKKKNFKNIICIAFTLITFLELVLNGYYIMTGIDKFTGYKTRLQHELYLEEVGDINDFISSRNKGFMRWDKTFHHTKNDSLYFDYSSATSFVSTFNGDLIDVFRNFGMLNDVFTSQYDGSTILTDCLFGLKFIASGKPLNDEYKEIKTLGKYNVYRNPYALPLGFVTSNNVLTPQEYTESFLGNQTLFAEAVLGDSYAQENDIEPINHRGIRKKEVFEDEIYFYAESDGAYYLSMPDKYEGDFYVIVNDVYSNYTYDKNNKRIFYLGKMNTGDHVRVGFVRNCKMSELEIYSFNTEKFKADCLEKAENPGFVLTEMGNTWVKGKAKLSSNEALFTAIPYEKGWEAYANGEKVEVLAAQDAFIALELPEGEYDIELKYHVPGLKISFIISLATLLGVIIYAIAKKRVRVK